MPNETVLLLIQTIVLALTGGVVFWYTLETQKIRRETQRQNTLLGDQLALARQTSASENVRIAALSAPIFEVAGEYSGAGGKLEFTNRGAPVRNVILIDAPPELGAAMNAQPYLGTGKMMRVRLAGVPSNVDSFSLVFSYQDELGSKQAMRMLRHSNGTWAPENAPEFLS